MYICSSPFKTLKYRKHSSPNLLSLEVRGTGQKYQQTNNKRITVGFFFGGERGGVWPFPIQEKEINWLGYFKLQSHIFYQLSQTDSGGRLMFSIGDFIEAKATEIKEETSYPGKGLFWVTEILKYEESFEPYEYCTISSGKLFSHLKPQWMLLCP